MYRTNFAELVQASLNLARCKQTKQTYGGLIREYKQIDNLKRISVSPVWYFSESACTDSREFIAHVYQKYPPGVLFLNEGDFRVNDK